MCLSVPYQVIRTDGVTATVAQGGTTRDVSLLMVAEPVAIGDYVTVQVGDFAVERIEPDDALETLAVLREFS